jgi:hypothetical protein
VMHFFFLCSNSYYNNENGDKVTPSLPPDLEPIKSKQPAHHKLSQPIELESLFQSAVVTNDGSSSVADDYKRFQSHPSRKQSLMKCKAISEIIGSIQQVIDNLFQKYAIRRADLC